VTIISRAESKKGSMLTFETLLLVGIGHVSLSEDDTNGAGYSSCLSVLVS